METALTLAFETLFPRGIARYAVGGLFVGLGVAGSASRTSLANVATFVTVAVGTAQLVAALGLSP